jgi:hypothetical protein
VLNYSPADPGLNPVAISHCTSRRHET